MAAPYVSAFPESAVPLAPEDPLFGLVRAFKADEAPNKLDLSIGVYRDDNAKPWVLPVVKKAEDIIHADTSVNHEYLPIRGLETFTRKAAELIVGGESAALGDKRVASFQTVSGTGALRLGASFLARFYRGSRVVYLPDPTWVNHHQVFGNAGLTVAKYPYFDQATRGLDFAGLKAALDAAPDASVVLLHACAHNPTGVDPSPDQWRELADLVRRKRHLPFFDSAYQGFASGDLARDAAPVRLFVDRGLELLIAQSFAKNFGLYGERAGCFHYVSAPGSGAADTVARVDSQLAILQRSEISNPPLYGARVAATVLNDPALFAQWQDDLKTMSGRIMGMRQALRASLERRGTPGSWRHITDQIGMFSFTGLSEQQVARLRDEFHVYMAKNGRISMAGLNTGNVDRFAEAVDRVVRETK